MEKYIKVRKIGEGSFGVAFLARTKDNGKQVVLKEINMNKVCFLIDFTVENHKFQCYCHLLMLEMQTSRPLLNTLESLNLINLASEQLDLPLQSYYRLYITHTASPKTNKYPFKTSSKLKI